MKLSAFGSRFAEESGIGELMSDLGTALSENPEMIFMGGGNPARLIEVEEIFQHRLEAILADPAQRHSLLGIYQSPQGDAAFRKELAGFLSREFGLRVGEQNIAISNGSQAAFFLLFNMLAGEMPDGSRRRIHLPLAPEYVGYGDIGLSTDFFSATRPTIDLLDDNLFKYRVDFSGLNPGKETAALCVSRPTNPTGNVLTDAELSHLDEIAQAGNIPLIIDGAYGLPFPAIQFEPATPFWNDRTILVLSLSKLGLPGARTGIVIAREDLIQTFTQASTVVSLACGTLGPALARALFASGEMTALSGDYITPFYRQRSQEALVLLQREMGDLPYRVHKPEGAIFLWLWFEGLPISSQELYQRLKRHGVLVVPGHNFFVGLEDDWPHRHECIRVSYAQDSAKVAQGIAIIAAEVRRAFEGS